MKPLTPTSVGRLMIGRRPKPGQIDNYQLDEHDIKTIFADSQRRQIVLTLTQQAKVAEMLRKNPKAGITITFNKQTGEVDIQEAKTPWTG